MPYLEDVLVRREFSVRWKSPVRSEVEEYIVSTGGRKLVGVVCVTTGLGAENAANKYIGSRISGVTLQNGKNSTVSLANGKDTQRNKSRSTERSLLWQRR